MKLTILLLILLVRVSWAENANAQVARISIDAQNQSIAEILENVEKQTDFSFIYDSKSVDTERKVSVQAEKENIFDVLNQMFAGSDIAYTVVNKKIILNKSEELLSAQQQSIPITGTVTDKNGEAMPGVNVTVKGTTIGIATDVNGKYSLNIPNKNAVLVFTFLGYASQEISVGNRTVINVVMAEDTKSLEEVVVVGYGTMKKRDLTGAVSQFKSSTVANEAPRDVTDMLRENVAGLNIGNYSASAKPGSSIGIRGRNTLNASSTPLLVIDGEIYYGALADINPADIETIDVLKDASSAAVYGAKAASGVVVITTKKGLLGKPKINVDVALGLVTMGANQPVLNGAEFLQWRSDLQQQRFRTIAAANPSMYNNPNNLPAGVTQAQWLAYDGSTGDPMNTWLRRLELQDNEIKNYQNGKETDWYHAVFGSRWQQDYNVSLSGKKDEISYYWSVGYTDNEGLIYGEKYSALRSRINLDATVTNFLSVGMNTQFAIRDESHLYANDYLYPIANWEAIRTASPWGDMYNDDGTYRARPAGNDNMTVNPFYEMQYISRDRGFTTLNSSLYAKVKLPFNITFQSTFVPRYQFFNYFNHQSAKHVDWAGLGGVAIREDSKIFQWQVDNLLKWSKTFGIHSFDITLLQNSEKYQDWDTKVTSQKFSPNDQLGYHFLAGATSHLGSSSDNVSTGAAYMARVFYSLMDKYMVTGTFRRDGYSAFGQMHPWANFGSAALAWRFTEENFWNSSLKNILNYGKLRLSYGTNGNRDIGMYQALANMTASGKYFYVNNNSGALYSRSQMFVSRMSNKELKWERTASLNLGLDFTLHNSIIDGSIDVYTASTKDLLMARTLPDIVGFASVMSNLGEVQNRGLEITLNSTNIKKEGLIWRSSFSFSTNKNKIVHLYGNMVDVKDANGNVIGQKEADYPGNNWFIGKPIDVVWELKPQGVWQIGEEAEAAKYGAVPGDFKIVKKTTPTDGKYTLTDADKDFIGQYTPKFRWSLRNDVTFLKNFNLSFLIYSNWGQIAQFNYAKNTRPSAAERLTDYKFPHWTPDNPINDYARIYSRDPASFNIWWDNSFIRLDNISLAYNMPAKLSQKFSVQNLKLFFTIRNVAFWAPKWNFWDPENFGPTPRTFTMGLNMAL